MKNKFKILCSCLLLIESLSFLSPVNAAPGDLDLTFSQDGKLYDFFTSFNVGDILYGTAIQADGKIVTVGKTYLGNNKVCGITRYKQDGTLDPTFDSDGKVLTAPGITFSCRAVAIQTDGKIVAAGYRGNGNNDDFALVRLNPNGSFDTSFDGDGKVITPIPTTKEQAQAVVLQPDGKIVITGYSINNEDYGSLAVLRYNTNGSLDTSFNGGGMAFTLIGQGRSSKGNAFCCRF